jgi:hypothetical protein
VRIERLPAVQIAGSLLMIAFIAFLVLWNLPAGQPRQDLSPVVNPVVQALGMEQNWELFAPNPRAEGLQLVASSRSPTSGPSRSARRTTGSCSARTETIGGGSWSSTSASTTTSR